MSQPEHRKEGRSELIAVLAIFALAWALRVWGLKFGLPFPEARPDELPMAHRALRMFSGDLNPHHFAYGTLFPYLLAICYGVWFAVRMAFGTGLDALVTELALDSSALLMIGRHLSAFLGALTVLPVYLMGRRLGGRNVGYIASFFCAVTLLHVRDSHFGVTDVPMTFFIATGLWLVLRLRDHGRLRDYLLAGAVAGLAVSIKYAGVFLLAPLWVAHLAWRRNESGSLRELLGHRGPPIYLAGMILAFLATTPYAVLDYQAFLGHFLYETVDHLATGHGLDLGRGWTYHLTDSLAGGMGILMLGASIAGMAQGLRSRAPQALVLIAFVAAYYGVAGSGRTVFVRYMLPIVPVLCVLAAAGVSWLGARRSILAAAVIAAPTLLASVRLDIGLSQSDSRVLAAQWMSEHVAPGAQVGLVGFPSLHLDLPETLAGLQARAEATEAEGGSGRLLRAEMEWRRLNSPDSGFDLIETGTTGAVLPDYIVVPRVPLELYSTLPSGLEARLALEYDLIHTEPGAGPAIAGVWYDPLDAFLFPIKGGEKVLRPGPDLEIYRRRVPAPPAGQ